MFSGKSSVLQARIRRFDTLGWKTLVLTSALDTRDDKVDGSFSSVMTHDGVGMPALAVRELAPIRQWKDYEGARAILIEEAQFFPDLLQFVLHAVEVDGKDIVVVGLDGDRDRNRFGQVLDLIPYADVVTKLTALCCRCGDGSPALFSALLRHTPSSSERDGQIRVGGAGVYEPMCRRHFLQYRRDLPPY
ncbi:hypothetical protein PBRA_009455 [Plasmodiophora brassicae]|nr:hypothetical protein PBRA_009455 [Plasmodiophora brassicae]